MLLTLNLNPWLKVEAAETVLYPWRMPVDIYIYYIDIHISNTLFALLCKCYHCTLAWLTQIFIVSLSFCHMELLKVHFFTIILLT